MMVENLNDEASHFDVSSDEFVESQDGELYRLQIPFEKKIFTKPRHDSSKGNTKGGGKGRTDKNVSVAGALVTSERIAEPRLINGGPPEICTLRKRCWKLRGRSP